MDPLPLKQLKGHDDEILTCDDLDGKLGLDSVVESMVASEESREIERPHQGGASAPQGVERPRVVDCSLPTVDSPGRFANCA